MKSISKTVAAFAEQGRPCKTEGCQHPAHKGRRFCLSCIRKADNIRAQVAAKKAKLAVRKAAQKEKAAAAKTISHDTLHDLWRDVVAARAGQQCEVCGAPRRVNDKGKELHHDPHHIYSSKWEWGRYDPDNGVYLCSNCHNFGKQSAHKAPVLFYEWLVKKRGAEMLAELARRHNGFYKLTNEERRRVRDELLKELALLLGV